MKKKASDKKLEYIQRFKKEKNRNFLLTLNRDYDMDIISYMEQIDNKNAYLKDLIREDIKKREE